MYKCYDCAMYDTCAYVNDKSTIKAIIPACDRFKPKGVKYYGNYEKSGEDGRESQKDES